MKDSKISIIIPIYNSEIYLKRCLDSVINQTYKDLEIILIDDGSTDKSYDICKQYSLNDSRIKLIHENNAGVSFARNIGLKNSTGEYIGFVDPDDFIESTMYEKLFNHMNYEIDITMCNYNIWENDKNTQSNIKFNNNTISGNDLLYGIFERKYMGSLWNKLFKRNVIFKNNNLICFNENIYLCEDVVFLSEVLKNKKIQILNEPLYNYSIHGNSLSNGILTKKQLTFFKAYDIIINNCYNYNDTNLIKKAYFFTVSGITDFFDRILFLDLDNVYEYNNELQKLKKYIKKYFRFADSKYKLKIALICISPKLYKKIISYYRRKLK